MNILIVGNGGREHALLWKLQADAPHARFHVTRPNGGMAPMVEAVDIDPADTPSLATWADGAAIDLVVVGPEAPLAQGLADALARRGIPVFGPIAGAARIESSKAYAKDLMRRMGVPTAGYAVFSDADDAEAYLHSTGAPVVVKASGLAAGKGAVVCDDVASAIDAARAMLQRGEYGAAGAEVVIEEFMRGEELSLFALCDGRHALPMLPAQDHKRIGEGDTGPNTGGMGAYAPVSIGTDALVDRVMDEVLLPTLHGLARDGHPYRGLLYAGLMLTEDGPRVVEFNCRFGDPETQVVLPMLDGSVLDVLQTVAGGGSVRDLQLEWRDGAALTTVLASGGYPGPYEKGLELHLPDTLKEADDLLVFHAGTSLRDGRLVTSGGRVLAVTSIAPSLSEAAERSRAAASTIEFVGRRFRRDIGWRELERAGAS